MSIRVPNLLLRVKNKIRQLILQLRQRLSLHQVPQLPEPPVWLYPPGFTVHEVAETGVRVIDNFLTKEEAEQLIALGISTVKRSTVVGPAGTSIVHDYRTSSDSVIPLTGSDPLIQQVVYRATSLLGLPMEHAERFSIARYQNGEYYKEHLDHDGSMKADRLYTVLLYLNDLTVEEGGGTEFSKLNLIAHPVRGRAVLWVNSNLDKTGRPETLHAALPVTREGSEKWVAQLWFRSYKVSAAKPPPIVNPARSVPLSVQHELPAGVSLAATTADSPQED